jgi:hypothetical protein
MHSQAVLPFAHSWSELGPALEDLIGRIPVQPFLLVADHRHAGLALQLRSPFYVDSAGFGLMCASPDGPCDDVGGPDASLRKTNSDAPDFLN